MPGFEIVGEASDGIEAVQKIRELNPDLILLDVGLPNLSGIEVARHVQNVFRKLNNPVCKSDLRLGHH